MILEVLCFGNGDVVFLKRDLLISNKIPEMIFKKYKNNFSNFISNLRQHMPVTFHHCVQKAWGRAQVVVVVVVLALVVTVATTPAAT